MADCPRCGESVQIDDTHCANCRTDLRARGARPGDVILVLDRGLVQFGKLILAVLGIFLVFGAFVFGLDLKDLVQEMQERRTELATAEEQIGTATRETEASMSQLSQRLTKAERKIAAAMAELEQQLDDAQIQVDDLNTKVAEAEEAISSIRSTKERVEVAVEGFLNLNAEQIAAIKARATVEVPRARAGPLHRNLFVPGSNIPYAFVDQASDEVKLAIKDAIGEWEKYANLNFYLVPDPKDAIIRIGLKQGDGSWSYVGTQNRDIPVHASTMNFGGDITTPGQRDAVLSQFGHAIGFLNEHQNPRDGIVWDEKAVIATFSKPPNNWSRDTIERNILRKIPLDQYPCSRSYDPDSIMMYPFSSGLTVDGAAITPKPGLSDSDKACAREMYPR